MTSKLEKQFFDTFEIKQREHTQCCSMSCKKPYTDCVNCQYHEVYKVDYPQVTDRILLELIFLQPLSIEFKYPKNIEELKNTLLGYYIEDLSLFAEPSEAEIFKQQVQALFKEGANDR